MQFFLWMKPTVDITWIHHFYDKFIKLGSQVQK